MNVAFWQNHYSCLWDRGAIFEQSDDGSVFLFLFLNLPDPHPDLTEIRIFGVRMFEGLLYIYMCISSRTYLFMTFINMPVIITIIIWYSQVSPPIYFSFLMHEYIVIYLYTLWYIIIFILCIYMPCLVASSCSHKLYILYISIGVHT